jgi:hypothetical protein
VNWSAEPVLELPLLEVTTTSTEPGVCDGATAVIEVAELTVKLLAFVPPNVTLVVPVKPVPVIVMLVPPEPVPVPGDTPVTVGPVELYVKWSDELMDDVPAEFTTVTSTTPEEWLGSVTMIWLSDMTLNDVATDVPNKTAEALVKPLPEIVTYDPPLALPELGLTPVTTGGLAV